MKFGFSSLSYYSGFQLNIDCLTLNIPARLVIKVGKITSNIY